MLAIGAPRGLDHTISAGLISASRLQKDGSKAFQTTAPVSSGSSGGPLLNRGGGVIGVVYASVVEGQNLNFAMEIMTSVADLNKRRNNC